MAAVSPPDLRGVLAPLLPALPVAAIASAPAESVLPLLSPILRQRVQFLSAAGGSSSSTSDGAQGAQPWIRLLAYDPAKAARLVDVARSARLEPHPLSGEVEIDWDDSHGGGVAVRYKRLDIETLQALVVLRDLGLAFRLVHCEADPEGGGGSSSSSRGWRVGEVTVPDEPHAFASFGGHPSPAEAERAFREGDAAGAARAVDRDSRADGASGPADANDSDDDYWAQYDATPARTPAVPRSPAPGSRQQQQQQQQQQPPPRPQTAAEAEHAYYAQYDTVQPAMDNHDPDEVLEDDDLAAGLGLGPGPALRDDGPGLHLVHPRPASASSHSSSGGGSAVLVSKLEESATRRGQGEFGVKQHIARSIKSLYLLSRAAGIDRDEFEQLVKTELAVLAMMDDDQD